MWFNLGISLSVYRIVLRYSKQIIATMLEPNSK